VGNITLEDRTGNEVTVHPHVCGEHFTPAVKEDLAVTMLRNFQDKRVRVPVDRDIRSDLHSVRKYVTVAGNVRYDADRTEATGHADRFWSLALALHGAAAPAYQIEYQSTGVKRTSSGMRNFV
jgi:phage FluMu gp28-like protein